MRFLQISRRGFLVATRWLPHHLLWRHAVGDNPAMEAEPSKADPPKRKRRWFQFSLRTLLIAVAIVCVACDWLDKAATVWQRTAMLKNAPAWWTDREYDDTAEVTWLRRVMGDQVIGTIVLDKTATDDQLESYRAVFPEASVYRISIPRTHNLNMVRVGGPIWGLDFRPPSFKMKPEHR
jgi:hypothetical protein